MVGNTAIANRSRVSTKHTQIFLYSKEFKFQLKKIMSIIPRSSADADNRLDAFSGQSRSTNMIPFHVLHVTDLNVTPFLKSNIVKEAQLMLTNLRDG